MIFDVVNNSIRSLLNPILTASWEKGLTGVADGSISKEEYTSKMNNYVIKNTNNVKTLNNSSYLLRFFNEASKFYK
jgi:DNA topoisomerase-3